jgi:hypothetical protein
MGRDPGEPSTGHTNRSSGVALRSPTAVLDQTAGSVAFSGGSAPADFDSRGIRAMDAFGDKEATSRLAPTAAEEAGPGLDDNWRPVVHE